MCLPRLVAALTFLLVATPILAVPVNAGGDQPSGWLLLQTFSDPAPGPHERIFTILPSQDYEHYTIRAYTTSWVPGAAAFQINQAGLAEVNCRGTAVDMPIGGGAMWHCDSLRPNHSYRIIFATSEPQVHVRLFGWN